MKGRTFGERVRNLRCARRWSKSECARRCGIKVQTLWAIEAGQSKFAIPRNLFRMADVFGVDARELALGKPKRQNIGSCALSPLPSPVPAQLGARAGSSIHTVRSGKRQSHTTPSARLTIQREPSASTMRQG